MYLLEGSLDQLRFTFDKKEKRWEIGFLLEFRHGSLKDVSLLGMVLVHINEEGELVNIKADDDLDYPEEFVQCAKINKRVQERIQSCQYMIKELKKMKALKTIGNIKEFKYDYELCTGKMNVESTIFRIRFGWERNKGFTFLTLECSIGGGEMIYSGSYLDLLEESTVVPEIVKEIKHEINKKIRIKAIFTN